MDILIIAIFGICFFSLGALVLWCASQLKKND